MIKNRYGLSMNERFLMFERLKNYKGTIVMYVIKEGERTHIRTIPFFESIRRYYV